jgi:hypothetical protein
MRRRQGPVDAQEPRQRHEQLEIAAPFSHLRGRLHQRGGGAILSVERREEAVEAPAHVGGRAGPRVLERIGRATEEVADPYRLPERVIEQSDVDGERAGDPGENRATVAPIVGELAHDGWRV